MLAMFCFSDLGRLISEICHLGIDSSTLSLSAFIALFSDFTRTLSNWTKLNAILVVANSSFSL
jgi:hypothetical protein